MANLYDLTKNLEEGHKIAWVAEKSIDDVDRIHAKTITNIQRDGKTIQVEAKGIRGGEYYYTVDSSGSSEAFFVNPEKENPVSKGSVAFMELTESDDIVTVKRGVYDSR
ncbi:hypothetical protein ACOZ4L_05080 [Haloplanus ruber]|uniref:Uncharacterized protein n=1 Tax=Haloplanus ruber TaxID=869892 RepID=A0ABD6D1L4_9EURY|nr:hypothetical protein [Haloplanus ruber]